LKRLLVLNVIYVVKL